jgi:hypothetical protein
MLAHQVKRRNRNSIYRELRERGSRNVPGEMGPGGGCTPVRPGAGRRGGGTSSARSATGAAAGGGAAPCTVGRERGEKGPRGVLIHHTTHRLVRSQVRSARSSYGPWAYPCIGSITGLSLTQRHNSRKPIICARKKEIMLRYLLQ